MAMGGRGSQLFSLSKAALTTRLMRTLCVYPCLCGENEFACPKIGTNFVSMQPYKISLILLHHESTNIELKNTLLGKNLTSGSWN